MEVSHCRLAAGLLPWLWVHAGPRRKRQAAVSPPCQSETYYALFRQLILTGFRIGWPIRWWSRATTSSSDQLWHHAEGPIYEADSITNAAHDVHVSAVGAMRIFRRIVDVHCRQTCYAAEDGRDVTKCAANLASALTLGTRFE